MSIFTLLSGPITKLLGEAGKVIDSVHTSEEEKLEKKIELEKIFVKAEAQILAHAETIYTAKRDILVAELQQGDTFTKRARPSLVYMGLLFAFAETVVRIILVLQGKAMPEGLTTVVPPQFWAAWTGVTGLWVIGRSAEKRGSKNKFVSAITGSSFAD